MNDHIEDVCRRLAAEGWLAVAPHLFHRSGDPKLGYDDFSQVMPHMQALTAEDVLSDVDAALAHLEQAGIPRSRIGVTGFCMGGTVTLATATERDVGAGVTFYGGGVREGRFGFPSGIELAPRLRAPWLGLYGDLDQSIAVDDVEEPAPRAGRVRPAHRGRALRRRRSRLQLRPAGRLRRAAAADAWSRTLAWFDRYLLALTAPNELARLRSRGDRSAREFGAGGAGVDAEGSWRSPSATVPRDAIPVSPACRRAAGARACTPAAHPRRRAPQLPDAPALWVVGHRPHDLVARAEPDRRDARPRTGRVERAPHLDLVRERPERSLFGIAPQHDRGGESRPVERHVVRSFRGGHVRGGQNAEENGRRAACACSTYNARARLVPSVRDFAACPIA